MLAVLKLVILLGKWLSLFADRCWLFLLWLVLLSAATFVEAAWWGGQSGMISARDDLEVEGLGVCSGAHGRADWVMGVMAR